MHDLNSAFGAPAQEPDNILYMRYAKFAACEGFNLAKSLQDARLKAVAPCLKAALTYASRGWYVFPAPYGEKKSHKSAEHSGGSKWGMTKDLKEIRRNYRKWPDAGIGVPTGADNNNFVIEADTPKGHGVDGLAALATLEAQHGALPATLMAESPSGSLHRYYEHPGKHVRCCTLVKGVDVKGDGGMVIAPPSRRGDGVYRWLNNLPIAKAPQWLLDLVTAEDREPIAGERNVYEEFVEHQYKPLTREERTAALAAIVKRPNEDVDWDGWNDIGMRIYVGAPNDEGFAAFDAWSQKSAKYNAKATEDKWKAYHKCPPKKYNVGSFINLAYDGDPNWRDNVLYDLRAEIQTGTEQEQTQQKQDHRQEQGAEGVTLADFYAYMVMHNYIYAPAREMWPASSVNARILLVVVNSGGEEIEIPATMWLDNHRPVEMITWAPGLPLVIRNRLISEGGWIERKGVGCFNLYRPPTIMLGDADKAKPWVDLVHKVFPDEADHIIKWFAHRCQRPWEKPNHGLVLGSQEQGIGKDTILEGVKRAVGPWNFKEVLPADMFLDFNPFVRCVVLRINEAKDMGESNRFEFYEHMKSYLAAPPDVLPCNEKYIKQHYVLNCMGVVITTNHLTDGIYLPAEDRRHYVAWSDRTPKDFADDYWTKFYKWYDEGGDRHVAAYLATLDVSDFNPKAPPIKTAAFWSIVNANRTTEEGELQDVLDAFGNPDAITLADIIVAASMDFSTWLKERKNRKAIAHRLEACGYRAVNNPVAKDGLWRIDERRQMVYAKVELPLGKQLKAAEILQCKAAVKRAEEAHRAAVELKAKATKGAPGWKSYKAAAEAAEKRAQETRQAAEKLNGGSWVFGK